MWRARSDAASAGRTLSNDAGGTDDTVQHNAALQTVILTHDAVEDLRQFLDGATWHRATSCHLHQPINQPINQSVNFESYARYPVVKYNLAISRRITVYR